MPRSEKSKRPDRQERKADYEQLDFPYKEAARRNWTKINELNAMERSPAPSTPRTAQVIRRHELPEPIGDSDVL